MTELGKDDPRTLVERRKLADAHYQARDYVKAFELQEEVLAGVTRLLGADDNTTISVLTDLAHIWFSGWMADRLPERAVPLFEFAVAERVRATGANDPSTLYARNDLATTYLAAGQHRRAIATFEQAVADCASVLGDAHSLTRLVRDNLDSLGPLRAELGEIPGRDKDDAKLAREMAFAFAEVLGLEPTVSGGRVSVTVTAIGETLYVPVCDVKRVTKSFAPTGDAALELVIMDGDDVKPLIVLADNVIFAPEDPVTVLLSPIPVEISNAPTLISYAEMLADAERFAMTAAASGSAHDRGLAGTCLLVRCVIAGAVRLGMRPLRAVAWWQRGWEACRASWELPPFPPDPVWNHLVRSADGITLVATPPAERDREETTVEDLTVADFEALEPRLSVVQLDEEFVAIWKTWIPITPARFADLLMIRLSGARAEVALYPDGAGSVDLVLEESGDGDVQAVLQLRFDVRASEMYIDEIRLAEDTRGSGLFQRLQYNTEELSKALGLGRLHVFATGMGSLAFARTGWPQDHELYLKANPSAKRGRGET
jgi:tetratricopeptide (TPR) repeat protein